MGFIVTAEELDAKATALRFPPPEFAGTQET